MDHREVEDKYDVPDDFALPAFDDVPGVASVGAPEEHQLDATYYDTPDLRLVAASITLRRREGGADEGWHLKLPADGARHEVHAPLEGTEVPEPLRSTVQALVRGRELGPVAVVRTRRTTRNLLAESGEPLAEIADDDVQTDLPGSGAGPCWREVEVELVGGERDLLTEAARVLRGAGATPARAPSKLVRALGDRVPGPPAVAPRSGAEEAAVLVHARLAEQVEAMLHTDPLVREDLPGSVHRMRVATRRLRSALATYRPFLGREATDPVRAELKWLGDLLGTARDAEVQGVALVDLLDDLGEDPELARSATIARMRVRTEFAHRYETAHARCTEAMGSPRYLALLEHLDQLLAHPTWTAQAHQSIDEAVLRRVRKEWKRVAARIEGADDDDGLHEVRKAAKRLRYAVEPLRGVHGKDAKDFVGRLKALQDLLGEHHDAITLRAELVGLADEAAERQESGLVHGVAHARQTERARRLAAEFEVELPSITKKSHRRWLRP